MSKTPALTSTVTSKDGTQIAYEKTGQGPALVLIDGAFCHRKLGPLPGLAPLLSEVATVYCYDRRGRNQSGDAASSTAQNELEDLRALMEVAGGKASLFGMSSGAALALRAVERGFPVSKLILYEPPFHVDQAQHDDHLRKLKVLMALLESGHLDKAVWYFQAEVVGIPRFICAILRITPIWKRLRAVAPTLKYDLDALEGGFLPAERLKKIALPTLVVGGAKSPPFLKEATSATAQAIPGAKLELLKDQTHNFSAKRLAPVLTEFLRAEK